MASKKRDGLSKFWMRSASGSSRRPVTLTMSYAEVITWIAGLSQLCVACYALRLSRLFGTARVGWSLFSAFALLAILHLIQSAGPVNAAAEFGIKVDVIYALISLLLLTGMVHIETLLKARLRWEREEERMRAELESRVKERTAELSEANEELKFTAASLRAEVAERKRLSTQMENTYKELLAASRQAGMTEVATNVLHNVGNVLNSVNISASLLPHHLAQSKASNIARVAALIREHADDLGDFMTRDSRGQQLPAYLGQLAAHLAEEQALLLKEAGFVKKKIEHIKDIVAMQQNYAKVAGVSEIVKVTDLIEDALQMNAEALARHQVKLFREYDPHVSAITVEKHKVLQVLVNLVRNAKYACDESGRQDKRLTVRVTNGDDRIRIAVIDNGVGIPAENLTKIFNHGFTTRKGGHGFGLHGGALAAKDMGGALIAHSDGPGKGATFTLELPREPKTRK